MFGWKVLLNKFSKEKFLFKSLKMKKILGILILIIILIGAFIGFNYYKKNKMNNVAKEGYFFVPTGAKYEQILDSIRPFIDDFETFKAVAEDRNLKNMSQPGRYKVIDGKSNRQLVDMIKYGNQSDLAFRIGDFGNVYQMIGKVAQKTELDSLAFIKKFDEIAKEKGLENAEDLKKYFLIDTYNFFWTVKPEEYFKKFEKQYQKFWTAERRTKAEQSGLTENQIYALASIVYKESGGKPDEQKTIAGLYLNRYKKGMKLQSDPTVIYAINKENNFSTPIKRVLYKHLRHPSPYNTYANAGIPPGPICIVDKNSIDAVLNAEKNDYIFMAADPDRLGYHRFTSSDIEHAKNAKDYQNWLNSKNIK